MTKLCSLKEAVSSYVHDGDTLYCAGFTHLIPFSAGHEIIRQGRKNLVLARATPDLIYDQMVAAGCARKLIFSYIGNPGVGSLRIVRNELEAGRLEWEEYSHFGMISRLQAGAAGLPFITMNQTAATDLEHNNPNIRRVKDPYTGREVITVPPLTPDVGIIHVQRADKNGNAHIWGIIGEQKEVAFASKSVIITAEEIVDEDVIRSDPNRTLIPELIVKAVCHVQHCAHPSYTQGYYDRDNVFYLNWDKISEDPQSVSQWLEDWVYGLKDAGEYWQKLGAETHARLSVKPKLAAPVNYGDY